MKVFIVNVCVFDHMLNEILGNPFRWIYGSKVHEKNDCVLCRPKKK